VQGNDQSFWWLGPERMPQWSLLAKPYIYRVVACPEGDVCIGTDGNGGRLLIVDAKSGQISQNLNPALGGVGDLIEVPAHAALLATYRVSRSYSKPAKLLVYSQRDRTYRLEGACHGIVARWEHGCVIRSGETGTELAVVDLRPH
jgi:hypothetical protein